MCFIPTTNDSNILFLTHPFDDCSFGLLVSLHATIPVLNGIIFPPAPEFVEKNLFPFIAFCAEPYLNAVRRPPTPTTPSPRHYL